MFSREGWWKQKAAAQMAQTAEQQTNLWKFATGWPLAEIGFGRHLGGLESISGIFPSSPEMLKFMWIWLLSPASEKDGELESWRKKQDSHNLMLRSKSNGLPHFWVQSFYCRWNSSADVPADEYFQLDRHLHSAERPHLKNYKVLLFNGAWTAEPTYLMRAACVMEPVRDWDSVFLGEKKIIIIQGPLKNPGHPGNRWWPLSKSSWRRKKKTCMSSCWRWGWTI